ncbi:hypothetical protein L9F63_019488 [Diploptera punctata]|uniref:Major facilitator superfamily (MFS) profile domain-containing protein n=1 Tax=Diploptera punctata TaxID=6984 RepID=A0AAD7ZUG9_DIPPU|nr:hypothetical protein L9F63_019488 [Diploptera punctata]
MIPPTLEKLYTSKRMIVLVVYLSMFLDNILLTVVVPIMPDYLYTSEQDITDTHLEKNEVKLPITNKSVSSDCPTNQSVSKEVLKTSQNEDKMKVSIEGTIWDHQKGSQDYNFQVQSTIYSSQNRSTDRKHVERHLIHRERSHSYDKILVTIIPFKKHKVVQNSNVSNYKLLKTDYKHENKIEINNSFVKKQVKGMFTHNEFVVLNSSEPLEVNPPIDSIQTALHEETFRKKSQHYIHKSRNKQNFHEHSYQSGKADSINNTRFATRSVTDENGRIGFLLSSKALVQLIMNPVVGAVTANIGYHLPLFMGSISLMVASLLFAFGEQFIALLVARSLQGVASACISISGMCLVAEQFPDDAVRSRIMGFILGSMALGVLLGYPFGSLLYDFVGKMAPFLIISTAISFNAVLQFIVLDLRPVAEHLPLNTSWQRLLSDGHVLLIAGSIWLSTSSMAILEPCMPHLKWQLGMVFIPDSIGYFLGTNFFGSVAFQLGRWRVAVSAMATVGLSCALIPSARSVSELAVPHFCLGLGIGVVDAALVPLLADLMDSRYAAHYGSVYALQQMAVSLAYSLGPLIGGEMVRAIGFPWLMRAVGLLNISFCLILILKSNGISNPVRTLVSSNRLTMAYQILTLETSPMASMPAVNYQTHTKIDQPTIGSKNLYRKFLNSEDSD